MANYNKGKLYTQLSADVTKNYTLDDILVSRETKQETAIVVAETVADTVTESKEAIMKFVEPMNEKKDAEILGEFVEQKGELLLDSSAKSKKANKSKKSEDTQDS